MNRKLPIVMLAVLSLSACRREAEPAAAPAAAPATASVPAPAPAPDATAALAGTDATAAVETTMADANVQPAAATAAFDTKGFAGEFGGDGDARLVVGADGTYVSNDGAVGSKGTWTLEADGTGILLDPDSKAEPDRRYRIVSNDELRAVDGGKALRRR